MREVVQRVEIAELLMTTEEKTIAEISQREKGTEKWKEKEKETIASHPPPLQIIPETAGVVLALLPMPKPILIVNREAITISLKTSIKLTTKLAILNAFLAFLLPLVRW